MLMGTTILMLILLTAQSEQAIEKLPAREQARRLLEELRESTKTPAVSGAVAVGGKVVYSEGTGLMDVKNGVPATGKSVYNIGSLSKAITAIAVMQLWEQKKITLEDDIRKYVPTFPNKGHTITIRHLLTHTSGIRHYHNDDFPGTPDNENIQPLTWEDGLRIFSKDPLLFQPGKYFFYTSYGVNLLQGVIEKVSGKSFEQYVTENVLKPAGAISGSFDIPNASVPHRAKSYRIVNGKPEDYYYNDLRYKFASGGMIASVEDLVKLGAALNHGVLLKANTRKFMLSPQVHGLQQFNEKGKPAKMNWKQGILWRLRNSPHGSVAYECGSIKASNACLVNFLQDDIVAAIATNSWECCGWSKVDALAGFFRSDPTKKK
jgi:serine beta-lactamase-like protein LACTB